MKLEKGGKAVRLDGDEGRVLARHIDRFERLADDLERHDREGKLGPKLKGPLRELQAARKAEKLSRARSRLARGEQDEVALERGEIDAALGYLERVKAIVEQLEAGERSGELDETSMRAWRALKEFLESEELPGSERTAPDGTYCCQWRSRGLVSGERECQEYVAWYIFAWLACVGAAIWKDADATLVAGSCSNMPGCP
jgi:hypothetical protein